ncbi:MAG: nitrate reductase [Desulfobacteraceae bacterium]|nr:MAG: nitrate reductase [Desulfobacteraceae bacterium]
MHTAYSLLSGPLAWVSFILFIGGSIYRLVSMAWLAKKKDPMVYAYWSPYYALRSILHWIVPFGSVNWRKRPVLTVVTFAFHISLIVVPLFLFSHVILWKQSWDASWWFLPQFAVDLMTLVVIAGCAFFLVRRLVLPEVKFLTTASDFLLLAVVAAPFITGFWSYHQWIGFRFMAVAHIAAGELMLAVIPFTRLSHMLFFPFTRGYMGSEFGAVRHAKDW